MGRALAADPAYLLMDEPFGALDALTRDTLQQELLRLKQTLNKTIVFVTHDIFEALTEYRQRFAADWLRPFGFNNTYAITVRKTDASSHNLRTISDLIEISGTLRAGFTPEFSERPDGYPGLCRAYGLHLREVRDLNPALMYQAISNQEVDVICAFATTAGSLPSISNRCKTTLASSLPTRPRR